uniref:UBC core domain-containing protein n=1 Tax=Brassica oleracea var. oleracea TaxID=109376 RepID=A0A0D3CQ36_BRAOL
MMKIRTPKTHKAKRVLEQRVPKLVENGKKTLILDERDAKCCVDGAVTFEEGRCHQTIKYSRRNENIRPFESGGETSLEFFSLKTDCSIFAVIFVPPAPLHPHIYSNGHICLGISLSISFCFFTLCIMFFVLFLVSLCWMLLSAV